jgi:hypothetical protein
MSDHADIVYECPGCGRPVVPGEDYVVAQEYELEADVTLHGTRGDVALGVRRRFHVEHFRGRLGGHYYELVTDKRGTAEESTGRSRSTAVADVDRSSGEDPPVSSPVPPES